MKLGLIGDTHYTNKTPSRRLDDFWETQKRKTIQALTIFREYQCEYVLQAGDIFDNPMVSYSVISELINIFKEYVYWIGRKIGVVFGQHDIFGHSSATLPNSPLAVLESAGVIDIIGPDGIKIGANGQSNNVMLYGAGFGQEVPTTKTSDYNILIAHRMIGDRPLFPDQELESPVNFLRQHPEYNLTLVGDYHYRFISRYEDRVIINPGALVRKSISTFDLEHEPAVVVVDTIRGKIEVVKLDIEPVEKIFDMTPIQKRDDTRLAKFIEDLRNQRGGEDRGNWRSKVVQVMNKMNCNPETRQIIDKALEELHK